MYPLKHATGTQHRPLCDSDQADDPVETRSRTQVRGGDIGVRATPAISPANRCSSVSFHWALRHKPPRAMTPTEISTASPPLVSITPTRPSSRVTITYPDFWFTVRGSNTEPLLRLNAEGKDQQTMTTVRDEVLSMIRGAR